MRYLLLCFIAAVAAAQDVKVVSEFRRIGPDGELRPADRGGAPREILSPAVPRNAFSSFRLVLSAPAGSDLWLEIGQNPENAAKVTLYEEWPDGRLAPVAHPYRSRLEAGVSTKTLWMDVWVDRTAPVERIKVEPQLYHNGHWLTWPMEFRIIDPVVPAIRPTAAAIPPEGSPADASVRQLLRERLCSAKPPAGETAPGSTWTLMRRNVLQDMALPGWEAAFLKATKSASTKAWCAAPPAPASGPEWYMRVRDLVYRGLMKSPD